jgi:hypothetical protein
MSANIDPIFGLTPKSAWGLLTAANVAKDGTGIVLTVCTAGVNGAFVKFIKGIPIGTNVASVARIFENNGAVNTTAANNSLIGEILLPASTLTEVAAQAPVIFPINNSIAANFKLNMTIATAVAAGWQFTCFWEDA